jgi:hypothetical protein
MAGINTGFLDYIYDFYIGIKAHDITLVYEGEINHQIMKAFTTLAEESMSKNEEPQFLQKKVYHVMVECLQNIVKHASKAKGDDCPEYGYNRGIILVSRDQKEYHVTTGNFIQKPRIIYLTHHLNHINSLSKEELNKLYMDKLRNGHLSREGGAGLGLIDIRRKTGSELKFQFLPVSVSHEFFLISSAISRKV